MMSKRSIPILISLMSIALLGIVFIQYRWIKNTLTEKQELIDKNVVLAISNVEQQLNDHRTLAFISDTMLNEFHFEGFIDSKETDVIHHKTVQDSTKKIELKVMSSFSGNNEENETQIIVENNANQVLELSGDSIEFTNFSEHFGEIEALVNRMKIEVHNSEGDIRLDSNHVVEILKTELAANDLGEIQDWGIFDAQTESFIIQPNQTETADYKIPLFTTDILNPTRYNLHLSLTKSDLVWKEIGYMIFLSLFFVLIISIVFATSIKLLIKHKKISKIKSDFINNMTHEFKTPLASISLAADSLLHPNTKLERATLEKYVHIIQTEKTKLNNQVERILEVASLKQDSLDIPLATVDLNDLVEDAIKQLELYLAKTGAKIKVNLEDKLFVNANAFHLEKVLVNIIENGIKYSNEQPDIAITASITDDKVNLEISDKGIGMNQKQLSKAFDHFYRAQTGNVHNTKGFGLGLSYSKLIIEKMQGTIELKSKEQEGTSVKLTLKRS